MYYITVIQHARFRRGSGAARHHQLPLRGFTTTTTTTTATTTTTTTAATTTTTTTTTTITTTTTTTTNHNNNNNNDNENHSNDNSTTTNNNNDNNIIHVDINVSNTINIKNHDYNRYMITSNVNIDHVYTKAVPLAVSSACYVLVLGRWHSRL